MRDNICLDCSEYRKCSDSRTSWVFFAIGVIATVAVRIVTLLMEIDPLYGKIAWYTGVGGFFAFFIYKFRIYQTRAELIEKSGLKDKVRHNRPLTQRDYDTVNELLCGLGSKKERINFIFIFALSGVALALAIYFDFIR